MKQFLILLSLVTGVMMLGACKEKKQSEDIITTQYVPKDPEPPIKMAEERLSQQVNWQGQTYQVTILRAPADSLPMLKDDNGQPYVDNQIDLSITRQDGSSFFHRSFVKGSFASYVDDTFRKDGQLVSLRFLEVDNGNLVFSVVIGMPDAIDDLFVPLKMSVNRQGSLSIEQDDDMDMRDFDVEGDSLDEE